jgi:hypothetical protein
MSCPNVTSIKSTECIGNSLPTINDNFAALKNAACDNYSTITTFNSNILDLNTKITSLSSQIPGIAKAWVKFDGTRDAATPSSPNGTSSTAATNRFIYSSYNIDYVYKATTTNTPTTSAGDYRIYFKPGTFTTPNYAVIGTSSERKGIINYGWLQPYTYNTSFVGVRIHAPIWPGDVVDPTHISVAIFG